MLTRRRFLMTFPPAAAAHAQNLTARFRRTPAPAPPSFVYFGTDTDKGRAHGIYVARFDRATGHISQPQLAAETPKPSFLAISQPIGGVRRIYAVNEVLSDAASVTSFVMDPATGALTRINQVPSGGEGPTYISVDATGQSAFIADYAGSAIATYRIAPDGALSGPVKRIDFNDPRFGKRGPNAARQDAPHPHSVHLSPDNRFLLVNDLGSDAITIFPVLPGAGLGAPQLFPNGRPGSGPRHIAFHPNGRWMYSINELDSTIQRFLWSETSARTDPQGMLVNTGEAVKVTGPEAPKDNLAAEVAVSADGNFLYASNRGENSMVVFSIGDEGALTLVQRISSGGEKPRQFTLDPSGRWLVCGNADSGNATVFRRDGGSGRLSDPVQTISLESVLFVLFT